MLTLASVAQPRRADALGLRLAATALFGLAIAVPAQAAPAPAAEGTFKQYCFQCHGEATAMAGINLEALSNAESVGADFQQWHKIIDVLETGRMPPQGLPAPSESERHQAAQAVQAALNDFAREHDGDPGEVTVRRLTSAEYAYSIEDLTGLSIGLENEVPPDSVGGEGFTNYGDVQFMQDATLERYLTVAKKVADHAVIGAGPLAFFKDPGQSGFELSAINRIQDIYTTHGFRAVAAEGGRAYGLERYSRAFLAAWEYRHRKTLGLGDVSLDDLAAKHDLSPRFLNHIWTVLHQANPTHPTTEVISKWDALPAPSAKSDQSAIDQAAKGSEELQQFVINWPRWLFAAGELAAGGAGDERALVITPEALAVKTKADFPLFQRIREKGQASINFSAITANPGVQEEPTLIIWRNATAVLGRNADPIPLIDLLTEEDKARAGFGRTPDGELLPPTDFASWSDEDISFDIAVPDEARLMRVKVEGEIADGKGGNRVLRMLVSEGENTTGGRPAWALLGNAESEGFRTWRQHVLDYAAAFPQTSHGEPTPSDRDPIPLVFDNTYNQPERDHFHVRMKYFRDDQFLVEKMLDDETRRKLDLAWADLLTSFEYHNAYLLAVGKKHGVDVGETRIHNLTPAVIQKFPAEARPYLADLKDNYESSWALRKKAEQSHIDGAVSLAAQAWRRPLTAAEEQELRAFYKKARTDLELDHPAAVRAVLARILVSPAFLYRLESPIEVATASGGPIDDWEMASRLSYFLWSSIPDQELRQAASAGKLSTPEQLSAQVRRMLADPKSRRLSTEFFGQWLGFYRFDEYRGVDAGKFPEFTDDVKKAMYDEAVTFFEHVIRQQRPVREIVSADYTFLNKALAEHYGIEEGVEALTAPELVEGADKYQRGGLLRLGAVMTATSAPLRTSPVKRGDWVLRRVIGKPTPPPPPDAGSIPADPESFGEMTVRQRLEVHQRNATCASCHSRIDPLGFPLEHFDAVGRFRNEYPNGMPIDSKASLGDQEIEGVDGLVAYIESQEPQILKTLSYKLIGYALGRTVLASDQLLIDRLVDAGGEATFSDLAAEIVASKQFRYRRSLDDAHIAQAAR